MAFSSAQLVTSFSDETSLRYSKPKAHILAKVATDSDLDWLTTIARLFPVAPGQELKSARIPARFALLPINQQQRILRTLKTVPIHVTDPRLYEAEVSAAIGSILPDGDYKAFLSRLKVNAREQADLVESTRQNWVMKNIWWDSPVEQVKRGNIAWEYLTGMRIMGARRVSENTPFEDCEEEEKQIDFSWLDGIKAKISTLSTFVSKSGPVFFAALDGSTTFSPSATLLSPWHTATALRRSHAFDEGNSRAVEWVRGQRTCVLRTIERYVPHAAESYGGALIEVNSRDSLLTQGADVAVALVEKWWTENGLPRVAATFDHIRYNGRLLSTADAERIQRRLSGLNI